MIKFRACGRTKCFDHFDQNSMAERRRHRAGVLVRAVWEVYAYHAGLDLAAHQAMQFASTLVMGGLKEPGATGKIALAIEVFPDASLAGVEKACEALVTAGKLKVVRGDNPGKQPRYRVSRDPARAFGADTSCTDQDHIAATEALLQNLATTDADYVLLPLKLYNALHDHLYRWQASARPLADEATQIARFVWPGEVFVDGPMVLSVWEAMSKRGTSFGTTFLRT